MHLTAVSTVTNTLHKTYDRENGFKFINQYCMLEEIGRGTFGKVRNYAVRAFYWQGHNWKGTL